MQHANPAVHTLYRMVKPGLERALAFERLNAIAAEAEHLTDGDSAENRILRVLDAQCHVDEKLLALIPETGPLIVVANHPFGGVEGLLLASLLKRRRKDVKILANFLLGNISQLRDLFIFVDPFAAPDSVRANVSGMRETLRWLQDGGVLGVFPAGEVSHFDSAKREVSDPAWHDSIGRLARHSGASVLPVFFEGSNSAWFHTLSMLHPRLRTMRLPHEFVNKRGLRTHARIGSIITPERLARFKNAADITAYLRIRTYLQREHGEARPSGMSPRHQNETPKMQPVVAALDSRQLRKEIERLPYEALLVTHEHFKVFSARAADIPLVLHEIGRLREVTFRANHEGTGKEIDLDAFDQDYLHLFLWNEETGEIIAAYRLGQTDVVLPLRGKTGLYVKTLFNIRNRLLKQISPALEMGRSFVRIEYQRQFLPLVLLWRGIGAYVVKNPRYRNLFGPVSINSAYSKVSQQILVDFLSRNNMDSRAQLVRGKTPPVPRRSHGFDPKTMSTVVRDISDLSNLIADIEDDHKDIPILLKQYLKLGGVLLGFNIDPDFSDVLDGLILVDLTKTDPRMLERYMGRNGLASFLTYWGV
ncbi:MAG: lysophospholipid acyltransferase family protein [Bacteroidetes bacterium]|nr:lysophospholipid acyltransferase family protein [Bacteroidota bacterium]